MSVIASFIIAVGCGGIGAEYKEACRHASDKTIEMNSEAVLTVQKFENKIKNDAETFAHNHVIPYTGETVWVATFSAVQAIRGDQLVYSTRCGKSCESFTVRAGAKEIGFSVRLKW